MTNPLHNLPFDAIIAIKNGPGPLIYHVRDAEERIEALPSRVVPAAPALAETAIALRGFRGVMFLPPGGVVQSVPDDLWLNWEWLDRSSLLLMIDEMEGHGLPGLETLPKWPRGTTHIRVNGRPMALNSHPQHEDGSWRAHLNGYLDDRCTFWAHIIGRTLDAREHLIAALMSLRVQRTDEATRNL